MSETSHLSRYRPAVFVITGAAAAYGAYILYATFSDHSAKDGLHRSNAIHRRREPRFSVEYTQPSPDAPLGEVLVRKGDTRQWTDVNALGAPQGSQVRDDFPDVPEDQYPQHMLDSKAIESAMNACFQAQRNERKQAQLSECGMGGISEAMQARDPNRVLELAIPRLDQVVSTEHETIQTATAAYLVKVGLLTAEAAFRQRPSDTADAGDSDLAETENLSSVNDTAQGPEQELKALLYHIAETDAKRKAYEHRGIACSECGEHPIRGIRWRCLNCADFDLCSTCEASTLHQKTHVFAKVKIPLPTLSQATQVYPTWYPSDSRKLFNGTPVPKGSYCSPNNNFSDAQIDACFDQFTTIANVPWNEGEGLVNAAIDRRAFNRALTCDRWPRRFRPNALHDRMFAFYDTDANGLIGFDEFLTGISYLRGHDRFNTLRRAIQGFDMDGDGYVDRYDFLRLLRAKHEIQKLLTYSLVEDDETEQTHAAMETVRSSQPISSIFSNEEIPPGETRVPLGKIRDVNGDMQPLSSTKAILGNNEGWTKERARRQHLQPIRPQPREQLRHNLSRFDELLQSPTSEANVQRLDGVNGSSDSESPLHGLEEAFNGSDHDPPLNEDVIWQVVEDGFHEVLDPLFETSEKQDRKFAESRSEIQRWRKEIDEAMKNEAEALKRKAEAKAALQKQLNDAESVDPLMATALNSLDGAVQVEPKSGIDTNGASPFTSEIVPTDHESLTTREEAIPRKSLDELLESSGYGIVKDDDGDGPETQASEGPGEGVGGNANGTSVTGRQVEQQPCQQTATSSGPVSDPTMPQNRPNASPTVPSSPAAVEGARAQWLAGRGRRQMSQNKVVDEVVPSKERLEELGRLMTVGYKIDKRGGPGRLSCEEVEAFVERDATKELKGLATGWLEWASF